MRGQIVRTIAISTVDIQREPRRSSYKRGGGVWRKHKSSPSCVFSFWTKQKQGTLSRACSPNTSWHSNSKILQTSARSLCTAEHIQDHQDFGQYKHLQGKVRQECLPSQPRLHGFHPPELATPPLGLKPRIPASPINTDEISPPHRRSRLWNRPPRPRHSQNPASEHQHRSHRPKSLAMPARRLLAYERHLQTTRHIRSDS